MTAYFTDGTNSSYKKVKIKDIDAKLPNDDYILCLERLSKRGKVPRGDYMESTII